MFREKRRMLWFSSLAAVVLISGCANTASRRTEGSGKPSGPKLAKSGLAVSVPLTGIHMFDSGHGWLLDGGLYSTADGGLHWTKAGPPLGPDDNYGEAVTVSGPNTAWVSVGTSPARGHAWVTLYHTTDGGRSWTRNTMRRDLPGCTGGQIPGYLVFAGPEQGWLVTQVPEWGMGGTAPGGLYRTADGGKSWRFLAPAGGDTVRFDWLSFLDATIGFTVEGRQANADAGVVVPGSEKLYRTTDGGLTWQPSPVPLPTAKHIDIKKPVFFSLKDGLLLVLTSDSSTGWTMHLYATTDAGASWEVKGQLTLVPSMGDGLTYDFLDAQNGWVDWGDELYETHDGGKSFTAVETHFKNDMRAQIDFINEQQGWLARWAYGLPGAPVTLYKTRDGGHTWVKQGDLSKGRKST